jgi:hypothetical protein
MTLRAVSHAVSSSHRGDIQLFEVLIALRSDLHPVVDRVIMTIRKLRAPKVTRIVVRACELAALRAGFFARGITSQLIALQQSASNSDIEGEAHTLMPLSMHLSHPKNDFMLISVETGFGSSGFLVGSNSAGWVPPSQSLLKMHVFAARNLLQTFFLIQVNSVYVSGGFILIRDCCCCLWLRERL